MESSVSRICCQRPGGILITPSKNILVFEPPAVRSRQTGTGMLACQMEQLRDEATT
jgi:hypothetical protein